MSNLLKRLEIIENSVALGDDEIIALQMIRLPKAMSELTDLLAGKKYADAMLWIDDYRKNNLMLTEYIDPELAGLKMELAMLESILTELATEKSDHDRKITQFNAAYMENLGDILQEILHIRMQQEEKRATSKEDEELKKAQHEYEEFTNKREELPQTRFLNEEEKNELRRMFKKAAHLCHPDRLPDDRKDAGTQIFQELEEAHRKQDLEKVREILQNLRHGDWTSGSATITDKEILRHRIAATRQGIAAIQAEIDAIHEDETWQLIESLAAGGRAWEAYFSERRTALEAALAALKASLTEQGDQPTQ